jgi:hypothetical protein
VAGKSSEGLADFRAMRAAVGRLYPDLRLPKDWTLPRQLEVAQFRGEPDVIHALLSTLGAYPPLREHGVASLLAFLDMEDLIEASLANGGSRERP